MTLTELRYIVAVARERHFGHAADACFVSQPTLSVAVRKLEDELGVQIFERRRGDISVTQAGEPIIAQAQRVLEEAALVREIAAHGKDQLSGPLRIGLIYTVGPYILPELVPTLHEIAPAMPLAIEEGYTATLSQRLRAGELDVIVISDAFAEAGLVTRALYDEPFVVLLPASHPLVTHEHIANSWCLQMELLHKQLPEQLSLLLVAQDYHFLHDLMATVRTATAQQLLDFLEANAAARVRAQ